MSQITIPDELYHLLAERARMSNQTVEEMVTPALNDVLHMQEKPLPVDERLRLFRQWQAEIQARTVDYPPGFQVDCSRESIYEGR